MRTSLTLRKASYGLDSDPKASIPLAKSLPDPLAHPQELLIADPKASFLLAKPSRYANRKRATLPQLTCNFYPATHGLNKLLGYG